MKGTYSWLYEGPPAIAEGSWVEIPWGNRRLKGFVSKLSPVLPNIELRAVLQVFDQFPALEDSFRVFIKRASLYNLIPSGRLVRMVLPQPEALEARVYFLRAAPKWPETLKMTPSRQKIRNVIENTTRQNWTIEALSASAGVSRSTIRALEKKHAILRVAETYGAPKGKRLDPDYGPPVLSAAQRAHAETICAETRFKVFLLEGVTGAGKTEIYTERIASALRQNKQALLILPEIALSAQFASRMTRRFGASPVMWHSGLTKAQRKRNWCQIARGEAQFVIGARSALFLPFMALGCIVVDEEHDTGFKQEDGAIYHARDMAVLRAHAQNIPIILVSATPSLETLYNVHKQKYQRLVIDKRYGQARLPEIQIVDLKKHRPVLGQALSRPLLQAMQSTLDRGQQSLLFLNRRGYAPLIRCRNCGASIACKACSAALVLHQRFLDLRCHYCGDKTAMPSQCPDCGAESERLAAIGVGIERLAEAVTEYFPNARIALASSDHFSTIGQARDFVEKMHAGAIDIAIGTQLLTKGYDFGKLTLVGVIDADFLGIGSGDIRASERCFQFLVQVAGRAGRAKEAGIVMLQSYRPDSPLLQALATQNAEHFLRLEQKIRENGNWPPYGRLAALDYFVSRARQSPKIRTPIARQGARMPQNANLWPRASAIGETP